ncbi:MAG: hypothetical protein AAF985_04870 [Bacteroidota bacterium]
MKNWLFGFILLTCLSSLGACNRHGCKGGGWYGNRNLYFEPQVSPERHLADEVKGKEIVAEVQTAMPSR